MSSRENRPLIELLTGHWISMTGTALVTLAGFSWLFTLPMHMGGYANNPYIGLFAFIVLPIIFFTGLILIPIGAALNRRRLARGLVVVPDRRTVWKRAGTFLAVMTLANVVIGSQLSYRAVTHMETVQFCGQTCHVMKPQFTAHMHAPHQAVDCAACHIAPGATGFVQAKLAGTRQLFEVIGRSYPRPVPPALASGRLVSSTETCEQCHERNKPMQPRLRVTQTFKDDEANTAAQTVLMVMVDKIHAAHLSPGVQIHYAASDRSRQTIPWVEYRDASGIVRTFVSTDAGSSDPKPGQAVALPRFEMQCVDCHNRAAHSFETADRAVNAALASRQIPADLPFVKKTGLGLIQAQYGSAEEASSKIAAGLNDFYRQKYPDIAAKRANDINSAARGLAAIYSRNVFPDLKVTWGSYPNNLGHMDYPGCFRCHDGSHMTKTNEGITQDCGVCHNAIAVDESSPDILRNLGWSRDK